MKRRSTTPKFFAMDVLRLFSMRFLPALIIAVAVMQTSGAESNVSTQNRIDELTKKIEKQTSSTRKLNTQSASIESQINALVNEREYLSKQLKQNADNLSVLEQRISVSEKELELRRSALGSIMADMYVDDSISSLELLASSSSVSDFIDNQTLRESIQSQLASSIAEVKTIAADLTKQKQTLARVVGDQANQRLALDSKKKEQEAILVATENQSGELTQITAKMAAERKKLQSSQQSTIVAQMGGAEQVTPGTISAPVIEQKSEPPVTVTPPTNNKEDTTPAPKPTTKPKPSPPVILPNGGYPANLQNCYVDANALSYGIDPWGYGCRQCVSYTAWKVLQKTGRPAMYWGNAKQWPDSARRVGYKTGTSPRAKSVAVMTSGPYGHVAWVESVNSNGTVNVSQYNYWLPGKSNGGWGWYSEFRNVSPRTYQFYIYV